MHYYLAAHRRLVNVLTSNSAFFDVDFPSWTSKVEHIFALTTIFNNICTAHAQNRLFMNLLIYAL